MIKKLTIILVLLIPLLIFSFIWKNRTIFNLNLCSNKISKLENKNKLYINIKKDNKKERLLLEKYIIGVVSCEMPASFEIEALKAQALAARTFILSRYIKNNDYVVATDTSAQCYHDDKKLKSKWGKNYNKYYAKIKNVVYETAGKYLTYNGQAISALYFSMSNGYTENSENVFSSSKPYLKSVSSMWDSEINGFEQNITFNSSDFLKKLKIEATKIDSIKILERYSTNRVKMIKVNKNTFSGTEFRNLLGLRSTDFEIEYRNEKIYITTKGYGHGVGMSQYGANSLAKLNYDYEYILKYYYKNVEISKYN